MSIKVENIYTILAKEYKHSEQASQSLAATAKLPSSLYNHVLETYKLLNGKGKPDLTLLHTGLEFENFTIFLDEATHFNRYRLATLNSHFYIGNTSFSPDKYKGYCRTFEKECLKSAAHHLAWTHPTAESAFGSSAEHGDLSLHGSAAWKQRAFYDFLVDVKAQFLKIGLIRISIWDNLLVNGKMYRVNDLLLTSRADLKEILSKHLTRRILQVTKQPAG